LLNVTAVCLLLAAATVWAPPPPPPPPAAAAAQKPAAWQKPAAAQKAESAAQKESLKALEQPLPKVLDPQLELLRKVRSGLSGVSIVEGTVKRFSGDFEAGARHPYSYLSEVRLSKEWLAVPPEKRIFIIGAGKDSGEVSELAKSLKSDGYQVFFYDFCRPLCSSHAVGAMFGTSGRTMLYRTPSAELSKYVEVEIATARFLEGLDKQVVLISTTELLAGAKFAMQVAETPTPSPAK
jgi:hypothetical protein